MVEAKRDEQTIKDGGEELKIINMRIDERSFTTIILLCTTGMVNSIFDDVPGLPMEPSMIHACLKVMAEVVQAVGPIFDIPSSETIKQLLEKIERKHMN